MIDGKFAQLEMTCSDGLPMSSQGWELIALLLIYFFDVGQHTPFAFSLALRVL